MSRSGYSDEGDNWGTICWRGAVISAIKGRRGQAFLTELLAALDAMPNKRLIKNELVQSGEFCALGAIGAARNLQMQEIDPEDPQQVAQAFNIASALAQEIVYENDEYWPPETPELRWCRMRQWVERQIIVE